MSMWHTSIFPMMDIIQNSENYVQNAAHLLPLVVINRLIKDWYFYKTNPS